ncbi:MAG: hypothetical protein EXR17_05690, partial [Flavobacteriaceae bacterium]|nr:hypothetical protein [Flavobacteriaceae bacterium]
MGKNKNKVIEPTPKKRGRKPGSKNQIASTKKDKNLISFNVFLLIEKEILALSNALKKIAAQFENGIDKLHKKHASELLTLKQKNVKSIAIWKNKSKQNRKTSNAKLLFKKIKEKKSPSDKPAGKRGRPAKPKADTSV